MTGKPMSEPPASPQEPPTNDNTKGKGKPASAKPQLAGTAIMNRLSGYTMKAIDWLWPGRLAKGAQFIVAGRPEAGKGTAINSLIAAITTGGEWPGGGKAPLGSVIILQAEEDTERMLKPRLVAAGADPDRIALIEGVRTTNGKQQAFNLLDHIAALKQAIETMGDVVLVVIDPINSFIGNANPDKNNDVRRVLDPLTDLAKRTGVCVVSVKHEVKGTGYATALSRISGASAWGEVPRGTFTVDLDRNDTELHRLLHAKSNLGPKQPTLGFRIEGKEVEPGIEAPVAIWEADPMDITADEAMREGEDDHVKSSALDDAEEFLGTMLTPDPMPVVQIEADAKAAGLSWSTVKRAKSKMKVNARRIGIGPGAYWEWRLPGKGDQADHVGPLGTLH
jgi:hypothetical protein